jgi:hypothetical protein
LHLFFHWSPNNIRSDHQGLGGGGIGTSFEFTVKPVLMAWTALLRQALQHLCALSLPQFWPRSMVKRRAVLCPTAWVICA